MPSSGVDRQPGVCGKRAITAQAATLNPHRTTVFKGGTRLWARATVCPGGLFAVPGLLPVGLSDPGLGWSEEVQGQRRLPAGQSGDSQGEAWAKEDRGQNEYKLGLWVVVLAEPLYLLRPGLSFLPCGMRDSVCFTVGSRGREGPRPLTYQAL